MILLLAACGTVAPNPDDTARTGAPDPATVPLGGACEMADDFGGFTVAAAVASTSIDGAVADAVVPITVLEALLRVETEGGDCALWRRNNPYCDPACAPGQTCTFEGVCVPYPASRDLGIVSIRGLVEPVEMEPVFPGNTYFDTSLPHPAFANGELITLAMPGGAYGPLELHGVGVEALDMTGIEWVVEAGVDFTVRWPAPVGPVVRSEIAVAMSIDQHGVSPSALRCTFADDGEGTVPGAILGALVDVGVTGFPSGSIERYTADRAPADHAALAGGCLDFRVVSPRTIALDVVGHTPCVSDNECPEGESCNEALQICE